MSLVALANTLLCDVMPRRFHAEPMVRAIDLLLQERIPSDPPIVPTPRGQDRRRTPTQERRPRHRGPDEPAPDVAGHARSADKLVFKFELSRDDHQCGIGLQPVPGRRRDALARRPDARGWGQFCYIRDVQRDLVWSAGYQPVCRRPQGYEVIFAADKATIRRRDADIETLLEVTVSPEQPVEVRRITLTNHDTRPRELEMTSYAEVALVPHGNDVAHPAFGKLFLETEWVAGSGALLCWRRPRSDQEQPVCAMHVAAVDMTAAGQRARGSRSVRDRSCSLSGPRAHPGKPGRA